MKKVLILLIAVFTSYSCNIQNKATEEHKSTRRVITFDDTPEKRPHSPAVEVNNMLFISGQIARIPGTDKMAEGGISGETRQVLENLKRIVEKAGYKMEDITACTVLLTDIAFFNDMNQVYMEYFPVNPPARKAFAVKDLPGGALVEIDAIAAK